MRPKPDSRLRWKLLLAAVLLLGCFLRFYGLTWSLPGSPHPDENQIMITVNKLKWDGDMNPHFFAYGSLPLYAYRFSLWGLDWVEDQARTARGQARRDQSAEEGFLPGAREKLFDGIAKLASPQLYSVPRGISAFLGCLSLLMVYLIGRRLYDRPVALLATTILAFSPLHAKLAHFLTVDEILVFFMLLGLYGSAGVLVHGRLWDAFVAGCGFGLAMATKISAIPLLVVILAGPVLFSFRRRGARSGLSWSLILGSLLGFGALKLQSGLAGPRNAPSALWMVLLGVAAAAGLLLLTATILQSPRGRRLGHLLPLLQVAVTLVAVLASFFGTQPYAYLEMGEYWHHISAQVNMARGESWPWYVANYKAATPVLYQLYNLFHWGMGPLLTILGGAGLLLIAVLGLLRWQLRHLLLLSYAVPYFITVYVLASVKFIRYQGPFLPMMALGGGYLVVWAWRQFPTPLIRRGILAVTGLALISGLLLTSAVVAVNGRPHTHELASHWIFENIPEGSTILAQDIEVRVPKHIRGRRMPSYSFETIKVIAEPRGSTALREMAEKIARSDVIVLPNPGTYNLIISTPEEKPRLNAYYQLLFSGELGFRHTQTVSSFPSLWGYELDDSLADVGFWFFDHPKVQIFQRVRELPASRIESLIQSPPASAKAWSRDRMMASTVGKPVDPEELARAIGRAKEEEKREMAGKDRPSPIEEAPPRGFGWVAVWYLLLQALGLMALPIALTVFRRLPGRGYIFAKVIGFYVSAWLNYLLVSWGLARSDRFSILISILLVGGTAWFIHRRNPGRWGEFWRDPRLRRYVLITEIAFLVMIALFVAIKAMNPDIQKWEKPSEFAYFNSIHRAETYPPADPWMAGEHLNYYYYGWHGWLFLAKLVGTPTAFAYNLGLSFLPALVGLCAFALIFNLTGRYASAWFGLLTVNFLGNFDALEQVLSKRRFLGFNWFQSAHSPIPLTISEFPMWSWVYADLHPHVMVLPVLFLYLLLAFQLVSSPERGWRRFGQGLPRVIQLVLWSFALGSLWVTHTWELPTQVILLASALFLQSYWLDRKQRASGGPLPPSGFQGIRRLLHSVNPELVGSEHSTAPPGRIQRFMDQTVDFVLVQPIRVLYPMPLLLMAGYVAFLPFHGRFHPMQMGVGWSQQYTSPLRDFLTHLGFFALASIPILLLLAWERARQARRSPTRGILALMALFLCLASLWAAFAQGAPTNPDRDQALILPPTQGWLADGGYGILAYGGIAAGLLLLLPAAVAGGLRRRWSIPGWIFLGGVLVSVVLGIQRYALGWNEATIAFLVPLVLLTWLALFQKHLSWGLRFALLMLLMGQAVALGCDVIYIKDFLAGGAWRRMNSVFKFHFQVWTLWALALPVLLPYFWGALKRLVGRPIHRVTAHHVQAGTAALFLVFWIFRWINQAHWWWLLILAAVQLAWIPRWLLRRTDRGPGLLRWLGTIFLILIFLVALVPLARWGTSDPKVVKGGLFLLLIQLPFLLNLLMTMSRSFLSGMVRELQFGHGLVQAGADLFEALLIGGAVLGLIFAFSGTHAKIRERGNGQAELPTLNGMAYQTKVHPSEYRALRWLLENVDGQPTLLESPGAKSYLEYSRISMNTGLPTLMGWVSHVYSTNHTWAECIERSNNGIEIYDTTNIERAMELIHEYNVALIYVGWLERKTHDSQGLEKFGQYPYYFDKVFDDGDTQIYEVRGHRYRSVRSIHQEQEDGSAAGSHSFNMFVGGRGDSAGQFDAPRGLAVDQAQRLYVADTGNHRIQVFESSGKFLREIGEPGSKPGQYDTPTSLAVSPEGELFVADTWNHRIQRCTLEGELLGVLGGPDELHTPSGVLPHSRSDGDLEILVADTGNDRIRVYSPQGDLLRQFGGTGGAPGRFRSPAGLALDSQGRLLVADSGNRRIQVLDLDGTPLEQWRIPGWKSSESARPALAVDRRGRVLVTDPAGHRVLALRSDGTEVPHDVAGLKQSYEAPAGIVIMGSTIYVSDAAEHRIDRFKREEPTRMTVGGDGSKPGQFKTPRDLDVGPDGSVYVMDFRNFRVQRFTPEGEFLTKWGQEGEGDSQFKDPCGIAVSPEGFVFAADTWNHRIQKFDTDGTFLDSWQGPKGMFAPRGVEIGPDGLVYVCATGSGMIQVFTQEGKFQRSFGTRGTVAEGENRLFEPCGVAVGPDRSVYVADQQNGRIAVFSAGGNLIRSMPMPEWSKTPQEPYLDLDSQGNLYATVPADGKILRFSPEGDRTGLLPGKGKPPLIAPVGIALTEAGRIYVTEMDQNRVRLFNVKNFQPLP